MHSGGWHLWAGMLSMCDPSRIFRAMLVFVVYAAVATSCYAIELDDGGASFCDGGPRVNGALIFDWHAYWPSILNTLATLLLAFYCNVCLSNYQGAYVTCQRAKTAVLDFIALAVGQLGDRPVNRPLLIELWRAANLVHVATFVLADKARAVYSFENFVLPVSEAFGEWNGADRRGMFTAEELRMVSHSQDVFEALAHKGVAAAMVLHQHNAASTIQAAWRGYAHRCEGSAAGKFTRAGTVHLREASAKRPSVDKMVAGYLKQHSAEMHAMRRKHTTLINARGDIRGRASFVHAAAILRLHRLVHAVNSRRLASMPAAWGTALRNLRDACETLKMSALYRIPPIYRFAVICVMQVTLIGDAFILATIVGRLFQSDYEYASAGAVLVTVLLIAVVLFASLILGAAIEMEQPFGGDPIDLPCLSYVAGAAEASLLLISPDGNYRVDALAQLGVDHLLDPAHPTWTQQDGADASSEQQDLVKARLRDALALRAALAASSEQDDHEHEDDDD